MAALLGAFTTSCGDDDDSPGFSNGDTVTLRTPGTLSQLLGDAVRTVTTLKVKGPINGDDIICLRRMAGCTYEDADSCGVLSVLDLSNATMTAGGASYSRNYYTTTGRVGDYMFYRCDGLTSLQLPSGTTTIGSFAFAECQNLTEITVPESVTSVGEAAWYNCPSLTTVTLPTGIGELAPSVLAVCTSLTHVTIPEGVTTIGTSAFYQCTGLTSVTIPEGVKKISTSAFYRCSALTSVTIPQSVTSVGNEAFWACSALKELTLGRGVTSIGGWAFWNCTSLTLIRSLNPNPPSCGSYVFAYVPTDSCVLSVPQGSAEAYANANGWRDFQNIQDVE